ncbi:germin-like protein subfamily 1 member 17 [Beta vulgaris subsp. vulgaris]|uniref:germin-like protein subfamily 1 member 17 n=1 Tax=Beta vulgaris subsp. vulgaris TaxID=3555 RepID=UPI00254940F3|nr:germin-like protein subfamily 1 member 17 [Beta vulgaris subsp. vulgaris]
MSPNNILAFIGFLAITSYVAYATDPNQLQDFCIGVNDPNAAVFVNGLFCKNPMQAKPEDFFLEGALKNPGVTRNRLGSNVTQATATQLPGLNTLGVSLVRIDFAPNGGLNPPHTHPRATELLTVIEGTLYVGFVTSNQECGNQLFAKVLNKGDVFVFPQGLVHFQINIGKIPAIVIAGLSSQNPGTVTIANAVFRANPPISVEVLSKAFQLDDNMVKHLQALFLISP